MNPKPPLSKNIVYLIVLPAALLCGVVAGSVSASLIDGGVNSEILALITAAASESILLKNAWNILRLPLILSFLGFTPLGTVLIPLAVGVKGYTFSYTVGAIIKVYGVSGIWIALSIFGLQALVLFPALILLSAQNLSTATAQAKLLFKGKNSIATSIFTKRHFLISGLCFFVLTILVLAETLITPLLISHAINSM